MTQQNEPGGGPHGVPPAQPAYDRSRVMEQILKNLRTRQRIRTASFFGERGAFAGAVLAAALAIAFSAARPDWLETGLWLSLVCIPALGVAAGLIGALWPVDNLRLARALDGAARSDDRFASALQLALHHRRERAGLVLQDALAVVGATPARAALPVRTPVELKWAPLPLLVVIGLLMFGPGPRLRAQDAPPEVAPEEWESISADFRRELEALPEPETPEEEDMAERLERLAKMLEGKPDKKEALAELARLQEELEKRRQSTGSRDFSMRQAAQSLRSSAALSSFAESLRSGEYERAAAELRALAEKLEAGEMQMSAGDFEAAAEDLDQLAQECESLDELGHACRNCANAASSMNRKKLADSLKKFSECLNKNAKNLKRSDRLCRACNALDKLKQCLGKSGQCKGGKCGKCNGDGSCQSFARFSNKKGGLRAGWGTAENWGGGELQKNGEERMPDLAELQEGPGESTAHKTVSPDERARSVQDYKDVYAEMVRKAEADLALESAPPSYREYLRRYFVAIRPQQAGESADDGQEASPEP